MNDRDQRKADYQAYRAHAQDACDHADHLGYVFYVLDTAEVQLCEDGAFVEARIWVPKEFISQ